MIEEDQFFNFKLKQRKLRTALVKNEFEHFYQKVPSNFSSIIILNIIHRLESPVIFGNYGGRVGTLCLNRNILSRQDNLDVSVAGI